MAQVDKYDILADVVAALRDNNKEVLIETLFAEKTKDGASWVSGNAQYTPIQREVDVHGMSFNSEYAESIKIGKDISIRRMHLAPTHVKTDKNEYDIDNGFCYLVRTPRGEARFSRNDTNFMNVWGYALGRYDKNANYMNFAGRFTNPKLAAVAGKPAVPNDKKSKIDKALEQIKSMGIEPNKLMEYIQNQKQNG